MSSGIELRFNVERPDFNLDVDLTLPARGITGVFGSSGAGKTTLLRSVAGLESPTHGRLIVDGETWLDTDRGQSRPVHERAVGYVFQEPRLFSHLDVRANVEYGSKRAGPQAQDVDAQHIVDMLGIGDLLDRRADALSGGEAQRVAIARALMSAPKLVLMDEPLSSIDDDRKHEILPFLDRLHADLSVPAIFVSHDIDEVSRLCDQLVVLARGTVLANGDLQSVLTAMDLPVLAGKEACSVVAATVTSIDASDELTIASFPGGELLLPGIVGEPGTPIRARIRADDVSLCREVPKQTSILNILSACVDDVRDEGGPTVLVRIVLGDSRLLARITRRSLHALELNTGDTVHAQIKSASIRKANDQT